MTVHVKIDGDITYLFKSIVDMKNHAVSAMIVHDEGEYSAFFKKTGEYDSERIRLSDGLELQDTFDNKKDAYDLCYEYVESLNAVDKKVSVDVS